METTIETKVCKCCGRELPIEQFKITRQSSGNRASVCTPCTVAKRVETLRLRKQAAREEEAGKMQEARLLRLVDFTPRELMEELARRGYKGKLTYTQVHEIDIENF